MGGIDLQTNIGEQIKMANGNVAKGAGSETLTGAAIDRLGYDSCVLAVNVGAATGSPSSFTVDSKVTHCATSGGSYADLSGAAITQMTASGIGYVDVNLTGANRYLKIVTVVAISGGSSPTVPVGTVVALGGGDSKPSA